MAEGGGDDGECVKGLLVFGEEVGYAHEFVKEVCECFEFVIVGELVVI